MTALSSSMMRWFCLVATLAVIVAGFWFWSQDLQADAPLNFSGRSQSLATDPPLYTYHAKNRVLFDQADPLSDKRWILFEKSFAGWLVTLWYREAGVSIVHGRQVALALTFASIILILAALWRQHRPWVPLAVAIGTICNPLLMMYGTFPFLEISLFFFASLAYFVYSMWGDRPWGVVLTAVAIAGATVAGKIFGVLLLPALVLCEFGSAERSTRWRRSLMPLGVFVIASAALVITLYGSHATEAFGFLKEQSVEGRLYPEALKSPWSLISFLLAYGFRNDLYYQSIDLLGYFFVTVFLFALTFWPRDNRVRELPKTLRFALWWGILTWIALAIPTYSPTRYSLTFIPILIIACFGYLDTLIRSGQRWEVRFGWWTASLVAVGTWVIAMQTGFQWFVGSYIDGLYVEYMIKTLPIAVIVLFLAKFADRLYRVSIGPTALSVIAFLLTAGSVAASYVNYGDLGIAYKRYDIRDANQDIQFILGPDAVISGPYAAAITQENKLMSHLHFFGESWSDSSLLVTLPITHLAVDGSNFKSAVRQSKSLESAHPITGYWLNGHEISVFDISQIYDNPKANAYTPSRYEQAIAYYNRFNFDSALMTLGDDPDLINRSRSAALLYARSLFKADLDDAALNNYQVLAKRYPTDFMIAREAANIIQQISEIRQDSSLHEVADFLYQRAAVLNPWEAANLEKMAYDTHDYFQKLYEARMSRQRDTSK
jgi:tetratricopeptide (TPR) repeat protein